MESAPIRILLVEDDPEDVGLLRHRLPGDLSGVPFELVHAPRLDEAIDRSAAEGFDVALLDLSLPDSQGLGTVERALAGMPGTPIVVLTGCADQGMGVLAVQAGAQDYLVKGVSDGAAMARAIRYAIERNRSGISLRYLVDHDPLTNLPNRRLFEDRLSQALSRAARKGGLLALFFLDLNDFKEINDTLGHAAGDLLLRLVADRLRGFVRASDTVARVGGDEFVIILSELDRVEDILGFAEKLLAVFDAPFNLGAENIPLHVSTGISLFPDDGGDAESLLKAADIAMYRAKGRGGTVCEFHLPRISARALERSSCARELWEALDAEQLALHYQPLIDLRRLMVVGIEAFLRWSHPDRGLLRAAEFLPAVESSDVIVAIDEWVIDRALAQMGAWRDARLPELGISVTLSGRSLKRGEFRRRLLRAIADHRIDPGRLTLGLSETQMARGAAPVIEALGAIRQEGVHVSLTDFGSEAFPLARLTQLPLDALGIGGAFLDEVSSSPRADAAVAAIIYMGRCLRLNVVARKVERPDQVAFLRQWNCDRQQGFYFSHPLPAPEMRRLLEGGLRWSGRSVPAEAGDPIAE